MTEIKPQKSEVEILSMYERFVLSGLQQFLLTPDSRNDLSTD